MSADKCSNLSFLRFRVTVRLFDLETFFSDWVDDFHLLDFFYEDYF